MFCKIVKTEKGIEAQDSTNPDFPIDEIIEQDKRYGFMKPKNGMLTWGLLNNDVEISYRSAKDSTADAFIEWYFYTPIRFVYTKDFNNADIQILFRSQQQDSNLTGSTIAYAWYPFTGKRQIVINTGFIYTKTGEVMKGSDVEKLGIKVQFPDGHYETMDLDKIVRHEIGHKVYGLQHDPVYFNTMSAKENVMSKHLEDRDIRRAQAKAGRQSFTLRKLQQFLRWHKYASER